MFRIQILSIGKTKEAWLEEGINEYLKRLMPVAQFEFLWAKNNEQLLQMAAKASLLICLDPAGKQMTSEQFADFFHKKLVLGGSKVAFVIGGAEGLPVELKSNTSSLISLSALTMTHQMVRLVLIEQIYRALEILKGSQYHK